ncbi:5-methyltetrahydropteroyltriglutamate--homocysteine S-methyltransferase [Sporosarcina saromensis]|uniref:5-methyltetrahydropteroyltriglutamate--homocysteine methyltransferase n=1 Tax=Sporosarcina saromensis TaxID=359365 RepID=A0ABU4G6Q4_9BACL|nr:5-methyltetrahydropteroyltriglutamate--homocysteine S-methyltransferase [Sporosarcina saromensis]MDW0112013.1 5-methyltetrahydropteroyltriglutamate--homocysteine S-methyltransferase [Sporosarcina saromensis]
MTVISSTIGYPYIGENREWKRALESFWAGKTSEEQLLQVTKDIRLSRLQKQKESGIDLIPVGDFTLYDRVLDTAVMFGMIPERYGWNGGQVPLSTYFSMARGNASTVACEMTKWFDTNYHYIVPEYEGRKLAVTENKPLIEYREAKQELGIEGKPVLIGPYTFLKLSKGYETKDIPAFLLQLLPLYEKVLVELQAEGVEWIQLDEPILSTSISQDEMKTVHEIYSQLQKAVTQSKLFIQTYFDSVEWYEETIALPVDGIGLDFVHGLKNNQKSLEAHGFPADKVFGAGVIDGRNIWRANLQNKLALLDTLQQHVSVENLWIQPSCSLQHVPVTIASEQKLDSTIKTALAFADEKIVEVATLVKAVREGADAIVHELRESVDACEQLAQLPARNRQDVLQAVNNIGNVPSKRPTPFAERRVKQEEAFNLPLLPTTTIGSFPQTPEVRATRTKWRKGEITEQQYGDFVFDEIKQWVDIQEKIGLDVFVHGEFERTDMVEYFGEKLDGYVFTEKAWVVSYGSRCVKPPIIYGDIAFVEPMTVKESVYAQSLTDKPMKGMLTGPVTMLNWSFVRDDLSLKDVTYQIALALRKEIEALEAAGIHMIQVDEPALREGLPLKKDEWNEYLDWAVNAFRISTATVQDTTQIHTHMCYCDFNHFIDSISALDADVISIETSRSHGELVHAFNTFHYDKGIGLGVYDIHSPRVPSIEEMVEIIEKGLEVLDVKQFWINPDCGLKTRKKEETVASLENMLTATKKVREQLTAVSSN